MMARILNATEFPVAWQGSESRFLQILDSIPWYGWVAIVAIVFGSIQAMVKMNLRHKERMAMIQRGLDPNETTVD